MMSAIPTHTWRALSRGDLRRETPKGLDALWLRGMGLVRRARTGPRSFLADAQRILLLEKTFSTLSTSRFVEEASALRARFRSGRDAPNDLIRAFALVREAAWREAGVRHFPVQLAGGLAVNAGCIAEMATGEGKTLTATLPATIAGWRGRGCHIVTVNDYLATRDAQWMAPVYRACGASVAWITGESTPAERRAAYAADVTYATNKEVAADFLRDRLLLGESRTLAGALAAAPSNRARLSNLVQRGLECAIVDEADSVLIDEAVTPLIIAGNSPNPIQSRAFAEASQIASTLIAHSDFSVNFRRNEVTLTPHGLERAQIAAQELGGVWAGKRRAEELVVQALTARLLFHREKHYLIQNKTVVIVDDLTGRVMPDRTWRDGLHQAIEAKESLEIKAPKDTLARISFQRFFRLYRRLAGMTGTAAEESAELWQTYRLPVVVIPPNKPSRRKRWPDRIFATAADKWSAIADEIERLHATGRPVLIGARTVAQSERLSELLTQRGLRHDVLSALRHDREAAVIAHAGEESGITIATNMAGRGTDIRLGPGVAQRGGLHVLAAERHDSPRIDRQLFGRAGRQGDPGSAQAFVSVEDDLFAKHFRWGRLLGESPRRPACPSSRAHSGKPAPTAPNPNETVGQPSAAKQSIASSLLAITLTRLAQSDAKRLAKSSRQAVLRADNWLDDALGFAATPV